MQHHYRSKILSREPQHRFTFLNSKYTSPFFLKFTYCIKNYNLHCILRNYDHIRLKYIFRPLTKSFDADDSRALIFPHEYIQPIKITMLEHIHNTKYNHKLYNLFRNTHHEFSLDNKELKIIRALEFPLPLPQIKNIIRMLAKLIILSNIIRN